MAVERSFLDHVARHQVAAIAGGIEQHVLRPPLDAAVQHRLQRLVVLVVMAERQVVAEQQEPAGRHAQMRQQALHAGQVLAAQLDDLQVMPLGPDLGVHALTRLDFPCRARPTAARCSPAARPRNGVCSPAACRGCGPPHQQRQVHPRHLCHRLQPVGRGVPDEGLGAEIRRRHRRGRQTLQRLGNAGQRVGHFSAASPAASPPVSSSHRPSAFNSASRRFSIRRIRKIDTSYSG